FWINPTTMGEGNLGKILTKGTTFAPGSWQISLATSAGCFGGDSSVTNSIFFGKTNAAGSWNYATRCAANNSVSLGSWQHFVVTWDGNSGNVGVHIFKNGSEVTYHAS